uniref:Uncharacterized protein n=1 Tax=Arundo donax TaxID=35708 RepID=A0A0A9HQ79_ARUDO
MYATTDNPLKNLADIDRSIFISIQNLLTAMQQYQKSETVNITERLIL